MHHFFSILLIWREAQGQESHCKGLSLQLPLCTTNHNNWEPSWICAYNDPTSHTVPRALVLCVDVWRPPSSNPVMYFCCKKFGEFGWTLYPKYTTFLFRQMKLFYFISFLNFYLFIYRKGRVKTNNPIPLTRGGQRDDPKQMMNVPMKAKKLSKYLCVHYLLIQSIHECSDHKLSIFCLDYYPHLVPRRPHLSGTEEPTQALLVIISMIQIWIL